MTKEQLQNFWIEDMQSIEVNYKQYHRLTHRLAGLVFSRRDETEKGNPRFFIKLATKNIQTQLYAKQLLIEEAN